MTDQYNNPIPSDLVLLENNWLNWLSNEELEKIYCLNWFKLDIPNTSFIFTPLSELEKCIMGAMDFCSVSDITAEVPKWLKIDDSLKRYSFEDGFYHA